MEKNLIVHEIVTNLLYLNWEEVKSLKAGISVLLL